MKLGDAVTLTAGPKSGRPHVVVHELTGGRVQLCYCGTGRWFRRCRRMIAAVKPDPNGEAGPDGSASRSAATVSYGRW